MGGDDPHFDMQDYLINWNAGPFGLVLRPELGSDMPPCVAQVLPEQSVAKLSGVRAGDMLISVNGKKTSKLGYEKVVKMLYKERLPVILHFRTPQQASKARANVDNNDNGNGTPIEELPPPSSRGRAPSTHSQRSAPSTTQSSVQRYQPPQHPHPIQRPPPDFDTRSTASTASRAVPRVDPAKKERKQYTAVWEKGSLGISFRPYSSRVNVPCVDFIGNRGDGRGMERVCINDVLIAINGEKTKALGVERVLRWLLVIEKPVVLRFHSSSNRVAHGQSNSIESYQPEHEPARTTQTPRLQILYEPPPPPPPAASPAAAAAQQADARRQTNSSLNSYLASAHVQSGGRPDQRERRFTNNALPRENQINLENARSQERPQRYGQNNGGVSHAEYDLRIDAKPDLRRHQSSNIYAVGSAEYGQVREERPRRYSNGSINLGVAPQEKREPVVSYLSNDRILYEPEPPREPELERPHQRRYSNAHTMVPNRLGAGVTMDSPDRYTRKTTTPASYHTPQQVPVRAPSKNEELSFDDAVRIVAKSSGKPITECLFGGAPILTIREGSVQAKLLFTFAKACLAKEKQQTGAADVQRGRSNTSSTAISASSPDMRDDAALAGDFTRDRPQQQQQERFTTGNPLGRHRSSQFLSYKFAEESERSRAQSSDAATMQILPPFHAPISVAQSHSSTATPQVVAVVPPPPPMSASPIPAQAKKPASIEREPTSFIPLPSDDFISLKDFVVQGDGQVADRNTTSSLNSASTHAHSLDDEEDLLAIGSQKAVPSTSTPTLAPTRKDEDVAFEPNQSQIQNSSDAFAFDRRALNNTDISISLKAMDEEKPASSDMISLRDLATDTTEVKSEPETKQNVAVANSVHKEIAEVTHVERSSLLHPLIAEMYGFLPDLHNIVKDKPVDTLLMKKGVLDEIQDILQSLQMEAQFERHSTLGIGALPSLPPHISDASGSSPLSASTRGKTCYQCGKAGELADLAMEGGRRELYCQDCWELFFFSEDRLQGENDGDSATSATPRSIGGRDSADDAYKYSFHDSSVSRSDMIGGPWRYRHGSGDGMSSIRDSTTTIGSSITDRTDEVWL